MEQQTKAKRVAIFIADGLEEVEALTPADYLRRAGLEVMLAGVGTMQPTGAHGVKISADIDAAELPDHLDGVVLPGGMPGAANLAASAVVEEHCWRVMESGGLTAAICAAPALAFGAFGLIEGRRFTCYPGFETEVSGGRFTDERVVVDGSMITSRGPGTAGEFAVAVIRHLLGDETADRVAGETLLSP